MPIESKNHVSVKKGEIHSLQFDHRCPLSLLNACSMKRFNSSECLHAYLLCDVSCPISA